MYTQWSQCNSFSLQSYLVLTRLRLSKRERRQKCITTTTRKRFPSLLHLLAGKFYSLWVDRIFVCRKKINQTRQYVIVIIPRIAFIILPLELVVRKNCSNRKHKRPMAVVFFIAARSIIASRYISFVGTTLGNWICWRFCSISFQKPEILIMTSRSSLLL